MYCILHRLETFLLFEISLFFGIALPPLRFCFAYAHIRTQTQTKCPPPTQHENERLNEEKKIEWDGMINVNTHEYAIELGELSDGWRCWCEWMDDGMPRMDCNALLLTK